jgi:transposase
MGTAVKVTRIDFTAAELRAASAKCTDGTQVRRILALALVLEGRPRAEAASLNGVDRQTLSDWVHRYNEAGIEGLKSRKSPGREPYLTVGQKAEWLG